MRFVLMSVDVSHVITHTHSNRCLCIWHVSCADTAHAEAGVSPPIALLELEQVNGTGRCDSRLCITHTHTLSLSLSHTHTHTHTHRLRSSDFPFFFCFFCSQGPTGQVSNSIPMRMRKKRIARATSRGKASKGCYRVCPQPVVFR